VNRVQRLAGVASILTLLAAIGVATIPFRAAVRDPTHLPSGYIYTGVERCGPPIVAAFRRPVAVVRFNFEMKPLKTSCATRAKQRLVGAGILAALALVGGGATFRSARASRSSPGDELS
jgi:hypothetical protein